MAQHFSLRCPLIQGHGNYGSIDGDPPAAMRYTECRFDVDAFPMAVIVSSIFLGAYAGVVSYQESSFYYGLCFLVASISIYDEYINDILDMPEGSCFPRPKYRRKEEEITAFSGPIPRLGSVKNTSSTRAGSVRVPMIDIKPLELLEALFVECRRFGEVLARKGLINSKDIEEARSSKGSQVISIGLPAYALLYEILRSVKANSSGLLLMEEEILDRRINHGHVYLA